MRFNKVLFEQKSRDWGKRRKAIIHNYITRDSCTVANPPPQHACPTQTVSRWLHRFGKSLQAVLLCSAGYLDYNASCAQRPHTVGRIAAVGSCADITRADAQLQRTGGAWHCGPQRARHAPSGEPTLPMQRTQSGTLSD